MQTASAKGATPLADSVAAACASNPNNEKLGHDCKDIANVKKAPHCTRWVAPGDKIALPDILALRKDRAWDRRNSIYL